MKPICSLCGKEIDDILFYNKKLDDIVCDDCNNKLFEEKTNEEFYNENLKNMPYCLVYVGNILTDVKGNLYPQPCLEVQPFISLDLLRFYIKKHNIKKYKIYKFWED